MTARNAAFDLQEKAGAHVIALSGDWTVWTVAAVDRPLREIGARLGPGVSIDVSGLGKVDVAGAYLIDRTIRGGESFANTDTPLAIIGQNDTLQRLLGAEREALRLCPEPDRHPHGLEALLERTGRAMETFANEVVETIGFLGQTLIVAARVFVNPKRMRWAAMFNTMEVAGLNALAIIALLSFFIGVVVAYLGARILQDFGATVFSVELVSFAVLREFGVVITGVLLAGRTDSAFTAELGAMKMRQEVDALRVLGVDPMEALVLPRFLAMVVMTPLLTFISILAGLLGGMLICWLVLNISPVLFFNRLHDNVPPRHFWVGMLKAPVFGVIVALVGCRQGLEVEGDVASLGRRTTASVVQAIFLVIVIDAIFALWYQAIDW